MALTEEYRKIDENVCCPYLKINECSDTNDHNHLVCGQSLTLLGNSTIKSICIGSNFKQCIMLGGG